MASHSFELAQFDGMVYRSFVSEGESVKDGQKLFLVCDEAQNENLESMFAAYRSALENYRADSLKLLNLNSQLDNTVQRLSLDSVNYVRSKHYMSGSSKNALDFVDDKCSYESTKTDLLSIENAIYQTQLRLDRNLFEAKACYLAWQNSISKFTVHSHTTGLLLRKLKNDGDLVQAGEAIAEISTSEVRALLYFKNEMHDKISVGQNVSIASSYDINRYYKAIITKIDSTINPENDCFIAVANFIKPMSTSTEGMELIVLVAFQTPQNISEAQFSAYPQEDMYSRNIVQGSDLHTKPELPEAKITGAQNHKDENF